jgi:Fungal cellulose binding domain
MYVGSIRSHSVLTFYLGGGQGWTGGTTCQAGWSCVYSNPWYSQCLQSSGGAITTVVIAVTTSTVKPKTTTTSTSIPAVSTSPASGGTSGKTYKTSVTHYGAGDTFGSPNCNTNTAACFFYTKPGFSAAVSQNLYGAGPGQVSPDIRDFSVVQPSNSSFRAKVLLVEHAGRSPDRRIHQATR